MRYLAMISSLNIETSSSGVCNSSRSREAGSSAFPSGWRRSCRPTSTRVRSIPLSSPRQSVADASTGYCKGYLWPLFHYFALSDHIDKEGERTSWDAYLEANRRYARALADQYQPGDQIWIHDYHLMLVPRLLRQSVPDALIGFFLHSPFPSSEFFRCLPSEIICFSASMIAL